MRVNTKRKLFRNLLVFFFIALTSIIDMHHRAHSLTHNIAREFAFNLNIEFISNAELNSDLEASKSNFTTN
jgi:hypothetical protein